MRQVLQALSDGSTTVVDVPVPQVPRSGLLIQTRCSLISAGTERMLVEFGKASLLEKARQQPDKVKMVLDKISTDGLVPTLEAVFNKLDQPLPLGYCNVGLVMKVGAAAAGFSTGDRVVSNGKHAEVVSAQVNLCAKVPEEVSDAEAAFAVIGAIGLQGIRLAQPSLGEAVVVTGLGLIGLVTVQLLRAHGCRVLGIDFDPQKLALARQFGAEVVDLKNGEDPVVVAQAFSRGRGVDAVLITASTQSNEPVRQAALMCRKRGRIVLVGVAGLELSRADFYEKELSFQVSCSYGPGRYDSNYEEKGQDYPVGFVRWTEQRNFEAVLDMMASGRLDVRPLITHRFALQDAPQAYDLMASAREPYLGILLEYARPSVVDHSATVSLRSDVVVQVTSSDVVIGIIGAGNYASRILIPAMAGSGAILHTIASSGGVTATYLGRKSRFIKATTDINSIFEDERINTVVIATRHDTHADLVCRALTAGKHVFVEKPLALTLEQLELIGAAQASSGLHLCVGFNRRFAPLVLHAKEYVRTRSEPLALTITVNAGKLPQQHWTKDPEIGGGRILGEGCHFIDLARFLVGHPLKSLQVTSANSRSRGRLEDVAMLQLGFEDGSVAAIHYLSNGHRRFPKERIDVFWDAKTLQIDNFRKLRGWGVRNVPVWGVKRQDKGHKALLTAFVEAVRGKCSPPIAIPELLEVSRWSIEASRLAFDRDCQP